MSEQKRGDEVSELYKKIALLQLERDHFHERWETQKDITMRLMNDRVALTDKLRKLKQEADTKINGGYGG